MTAVIGLSSLPYMRQAKLALEVAALASVAFGGWKAHDLIVYQPHLKKDLFSALKSSEDARKVEGTGQQVTTEVASKREHAQGASREVTSTLLKEVSRYVPVRAERPSQAPVGGGDVPPSGGLNVGFGRLLDYAALGIDPPLSLTPSERGHLQDPLPIDLPAVAGSIIGNYGVLHQCSAEVGAWREWYNREAAAWPVK